VASAVPVADPAAPAVVRKRPIWPWFVGGGLLLVILLIIGVSVLIAALVGGSTSGANSPAATVLAFDQSFKTNDCKLFTSTTTKKLQDSYFDDGFSCDKWSEIAISLHDDKVYHYTVVINDTRVKGDIANVTTSEQDTTPGDEQSYDLDYRLIKQDGAWVIDAIQNLN